MHIARWACAMALGTGSAWACEGEVANFQDLAERLARIEAEGAAILNAEFMTSPARACREAWLIDILTEEGEVLSVLLDARSLMPRQGDLSPVAEFLREAEAAADEPLDDEEEEYFPVQILLEGGDASDLMEGDWSDDVMTGGPGRDVFVATPGSDVITDFDPEEDILDLGDFARLKDGFGTLRSLEDVAQASEQRELEGDPALVVGLVGDEADWAVWLLNVEIEDLTEDNVHFGLEDEEPPVELRAVPEVTIVANDDSIVRYPPVWLEDGPEDGTLIQGSVEAFDAIHAWMWEKWGLDPEEE